MPSVPYAFRLFVATLLTVELVASAAAPQPLTAQGLAASRSAGAQTAQARVPRPAQGKSLAATPPVLLSTSPEAGASWDGGPVVFRFDQALDPRVADLLAVEPAIPGTASVDDDTLTFTAAETPEAGTRYTLQIDKDTAIAANVPLAGTVDVTLVGASPLLVTSTQPSDGSFEVNTDTQIVVTFNRPVVPLSGVEDQSALPDPLTLQPPVEGEGRWLGTSVYAFRPTVGLAGGAEYLVTVAGIASVMGETLAKPYAFSFATAAPSVVDVSPVGSQVRPDAVIRVEFSQPMDPASTEAAFSVRELGGSRAPVAGELAWTSDLRTLVFTPTVELDFGAAYLVQVATSAQPASGLGTLRAAFSRSFSVVPLPAVRATSPVAGAQQVTPDATVTIRFSAPVSPTLLMSNITVSPLLTTTRVYSYYSEYLNELQLSWLKEPNTRYMITLGSPIGDEYGNTLGEDFVLRFETGDYAPFARLELDRFTHLSAYSPTQTSMLVRNLDQVTVELYRLPEEELFRLTGSDQWQVWENYRVPDAAANRLWSRTYDAAGDANVTVRHVITLTDQAGGPLAPGAYFLQLPLPDEDAEARYASGGQSLVVISNLNLTLKWSQSATSLAWLTDLRTGEPVAGIPVRFLRDGSLAGEAVTGADGAAATQLAVDPERTWTPVLAMTGLPGDDHYAVVSSDWSEGISVWDFGLMGGWSPEALQSHFYTDRPIYRPGQTVYWKGILRLLENDQYVLPPDDLVTHIILRDPLGNVVVDEEHPVGPHGTVDGEVLLSSEALTGGYFMEVTMRVPGGAPASSGLSFPVAAYRKPEFEIAVTPDKDEYMQGDTVRVDVRAAYFSGGALAGAPVTWRLIASPYFFAWESAPEDRYFSFTPFDPDSATYDPYQGGFSHGLIREGTGKTGADGSFQFELPADLGGASSQNWVFDVTVQSPTNQFVSASAGVPVHSAAYYIGLSPQRYIAYVGEESAVDVVTVDPQGKPVAAAELAVTAYEFQWNSVYARSADGVFRWETSVARTPVYTTTVTTDQDGAALLKWTPELGGQFQIVATGTDARGSRTSSAVFVWVSAADPDAFVAWPRENHDRIELVADKALYFPGDVAKILVPSPFAGPVKALLTVERGGVISAEVITLAGTSEILELPITEEHVPNIFVGVVIAKGVDETNPVPATRIGYAQLTVDPGVKALNLNVVSSASVVEPGATVAYTLTVTDQAGAPVPDAETSISIVDRAVLALAFEPDRSLLDVFYAERPLGVMTSALLTINRDRMSQQLSEGAKGGGGGPGGMDVDVRSEFPDSAFWRADLVTDAAGQIGFTVDLPDNLTTWRLIARSVTDATRVGDAQHDVTATKDLQVRPIAPRFFAAGDSAEIGAVVLNATGQDLANGSLLFEIEGARLASGNDPVAAIALPAQGQARQTWPIVVAGAASTVVITLTAVADGAGGTLADAVRLELPVRRYLSPETVATAGVVPPGDTVEAVRLPETASTVGDLRVVVEPSLAGGLLDGLDYLQHFPYECNEQLVSRFLPNLFTALALETLGSDEMALQENLDEQVSVGIQRLVNRQNQDGGWGYWPGETSSAFITAYVLWGLSSASDGGYVVPARTLDSAVEYLERSFVPPQQLRESWQLNETAFTHFVLAELGQGDPGRATTLYEERDRMGHYGIAYLAMALAELRPDGADDPYVLTLLDNLAGSRSASATSAWWQESDIDFRTLNTDVRTTGIVLEAFLRLRPDDPQLPQVVRWLMQARQAGHWSNTQENAWAIIALSHWLELTQELAADYTWAVTLNDASVGEGHATPENAAYPVELLIAVTELLGDETNLLRLSRTDGPGQMYYTTHLRTYEDSDALEPRDRGVVVDRRFFLAAAGAETTVASAQVGDVISVSVTIIAPNDLHQLLVEVPIPAGTEPIDPALLTTSDQFAGANLEMTAPDASTPSWWRYWTPTFSDFRDDRVALFATFMPAGAYEYTFLVQATLPGDFQVLPVHAEQMYFTEVWGRSRSQRFSIVEPTRMSEP